jgi:4-hydroxy-tetrahydrodipicolinate synthase
VPPQEGIAMITGRHVSRLSGYAPALPTPFDQSGNLDGAAFERLCERQIREGATALVVCGTTGEAPTLSRAEHDAIVRMAVGVAQGRVPVIAGAGSNATSHAIELARDAEAAGADALLSVVPYYNKPMQAGIYAHFGAIADAAGLPIILYDVPSRTVCGLADDTLARLAECPKFIGLKDATGDLARPVRLRTRLGPDFRLLSGDDASAAGFIGQGGNGCISVTSNVAPGLCRALYLSSKQGHCARTRQLATVVAELTAALFRESNPVPVKYALSAMRMMSPAVRLPLVELGSDTKAEIDAVLAHVCEGYSGYMIGEVARPEDGAHRSSRVPVDAALRQAPDPGDQPVGWAHPLRRAGSAAVQASMRSGGF